MSTAWPNSSTTRSISTCIPDYQYLATYPFFAQENITSKLPSSRASVCTCSTFLSASCANGICVHPEPETNPARSACARQTSANGIHALVVFCCEILMQSPMQATVSSVPIVTANWKCCTRSSVVVIAPFALDGPGWLCHHGCRSGWLV